MARNKREHPIPNVKLIKNIGGKLEDAYNTLRAAVDDMNGKFFNLLYYLDLVRYDDTENVVKAMVEGTRGIAGYFIDRTMRDVEDGKIKKEAVVKAKWIVDENTPPEEREKRLKKEKTEIHRSIALNVKRYIADFRKENYLGSFGIDSYYKRAILLCIDTLYLEDYGVEIDTEKFIAFYKDRMAASESIIAKLHIEAADALNRFFGGAVPITQKELERYFSFDYGIAEVRQSSVNLESYCRLGGRVTTVNRDKK